MSIGQTGQHCQEILFFYFFSKWPPSAILDIFDLDHSQIAFGSVFIIVQNLAGIDASCSNFDNVKVLIFIAFHLKMPIHAPKMDFWI